MLRSQHASGLYKALACQHFSFSWHKEADKSPAGRRADKPTKGRRADKRQPQGRSVLRACEAGVLLIKSGTTGKRSRVASKSLPRRAALAGRRYPRSSRDTSIRPCRSAGSSPGLWTSGRRSFGTSGPRTLRTEARRKNEHLRSSRRSQSRVFKSFSIRLARVARAWAWGGVRRR